VIYSISIAEAAENDIKEAFLWYENQKDGLGALFEKYILDAFDSITGNPLKTQIRYSNTRIFFLKKFPFGIHFNVDKGEKHILIIAVFHTSRNSESWELRR